MQKLSRPPGHRSVGQRITDVLELKAGEKILEQEDTTCHAQPEDGKGCEYSPLDYIEKGSHYSVRMCTSLSGQKANH